jgi:hypothetical protein
MGGALSGPAVDQAKARAPGIRKGAIAAGGTAAAFLSRRLTLPVVLVGSAFGGAAWFGKPSAVACSGGMPLLKPVVATRLASPVKLRSLPRPPFSQASSRLRFR